MSFPDEFTTDHPRLGEVAFLPAPESPLSLATGLAVLDGFVEALAATHRPPPPNDEYDI